MERYKAAIIGLGQIASRYQEDAKRKGIVTHAAAYDHHPRVDLVAGCDPDPRQRALFSKRWKGVRAYDDLQEMMTAEKPDIVSVCTPAHTHATVLKKILRYPLKGIWCEKPLALSLQEVQFLKKIKVPLSLNFSRRWDDACRQFQKDVSKRKWGEIQAIDIYFTGSYVDNATHALDLVQWLFGVDVAAPIHIHQLNRKDYLFFEVDFYFTKARHRLTQSGFRWLSWKRVPSKHYGGFFDLTPMATPYKKTMARLIEKSLEDLLLSIKKGKKPFCSEVDGLKLLSLQDKLGRRP